MDSTFLTSILKPIAQSPEEEDPLNILEVPSQYQLLPPEMSTVSIKHRNSSKQQVSSKTTIITHDSSKKDPFRRSYLVPVYPGGVVADRGAGCMLDVNSWRKKYFLWGGKQKEHLDSESLIKL